MQCLTATPGLPSELNAVSPRPFCCCAEPMPVCSPACSFKPCRLPLRRGADTRGVGHEISAQGPFHPLLTEATRSITFGDGQECRRGAGTPLDLLEAVMQGKLNLPPAAGRCDLAEVRGSDIPTWVAESRMVKDTRCIHAELERMPFGYPDLFRYSQV
jgi:hypothetical protein